MNLPNKLTLLRILLIPVFILCVSLPGGGGQYLVGAIVFALASFTDFLDGHIARKRGLVTDFGKFADPLADKILTTTAFLYMMADGVCHPLVLVIIITREFAVSGIRMVAASSPKEGRVIAAGPLGKIKTVVQMAVILLYYFSMGAAGLWMGGLQQTVMRITWWLCWGVAALTAISGMQYLWMHRSHVNTAK